MADTIAIVDTSENNITATVADSTILFTATDTANPATLQSLSDVGNVDTTTNGTVDGSVLVFRTTTNMWTSTTTLDAQNMEAGEF